MSLAGPPGSGKTFTALRIAHALGGQVGVVDTETGSADDYADTPNPDGGQFSHLVVDLSREPGRFSIPNYLAAMQALVASGCQTVIVDSLSHAWAWVLEQVDRHADQKGGKFSSGWKEMTPQQTAFIQQLLEVDAHLIVTLRTKVEWVVEGKAPRRVGTTIVQRDGLEYEFTLAGDMAPPDEVRSAHLTVTKSRIVGAHAIPIGSVWDSPGADIADRINGWLADAPPPPTAEEQFVALMVEHGVPGTPDAVDAWLFSQGRESWRGQPYHLQRRLVVYLRAKGREAYEAWLGLMEHARAAIPPASDGE